MGPKPRPGQPRRDPTSSDESTGRQPRPGQLHTGGSGLPAGGSAPVLFARPFTDARMERQVVGQIRLRVLQDVGQHGRAGQHLFATERVIRIAHDRVGLPGKDGEFLWRTAERPQAPVQDLWSLWDHPGPDSWRQPVRRLGHPTNVPWWIRTGSVGFARLPYVLLVRRGAGAPGLAGPLALDHPLGPQSGLQTV